jgi:MFS family permease
MTSERKESPKGENQTKARLPAAVVAFGVVSLLTDASSELIYWLLPLFLTETLGAGTTFVGTIEGVAESTAAFFKLIAGGLADRAKKRKPLTVFGYGLSSIARPLVAITTAPYQVLLTRFADRIGKGVRSSPRDAIVADVTAPEARGRSFGFHRAMDNAGAVIGPGLALVCIRYLHLGYRPTFALAAIPGVLAMAVLIFGVKEPDTGRKPVDGPAPPLRQRFGDAARSLSLTPAMSRYFVALGLFTLANSSDAFLILQATRVGVPILIIPLLPVALNLVRTLGSTAGGALSDRVGRRRVLLLGWGIYAVIYTGFSMARSPLHMWILVPLYGLYYCFTEGAERALVADLAPADARGRAYGGYYFLTGLLSFPASLLFGLLWKVASPEIAFAVAAALAALAALVLAVLVPADVTPAGAKKAK